MPIDISEFETPKFIKLKNRYPTTENRKEPFMHYADYPRNYRGANGIPTPGYDPSHNTVKVERVRLDVDDITFLPQG